MKNRLLKVARIMILIFMLVSLLVLSVLPSAAYPASFAQGHDFTPFHMSLCGTITEQSGSESYRYQIPLPNISYDFSGDRSFSSSSTLDTDIDVSILTEQSYSFSNITPGTTNDVLNFDLSVYSTSQEFEATLDDFEVYFQGGFLDPGFSMFNRHDGLAFVAYDTVFNTGSVLPGELRGEFYVGSTPFVEYDCARPIGDLYSSSGAFLSYYDVLYHSDFPFMDLLPEDVNREEWAAAFDSYQNVDFSNLTEAQCQELYRLFSWIGPIYGRFSVEFEFPDAAYMQNVDFSFKYILTDIYNVNDNFEAVIEDTIYSGLTGFERVTKFLGSATSGFFDVEILPEFSLGSIFVVFIAFSLVMWWLKVFAGG